MGVFLFGLVFGIGLWIIGYLMDKREMANRRREHEAFERQVWLDHDAYVKKWCSPTIRDDETRS